MWHFVTITLWFSLRKTEIFLIVILSVGYQDVSLHIFRFHLIVLFCILQYCEYRSYMSFIVLCAVLSHFRRVRLFAPPWTVAHQVPLSVGFSRQEYWSGLPFPSPGDLPNAGIKPASPAVGEVGGWRCVLYLCATREALPLLFNWWDDYIPTHAVRHWLQFQLSVKSGASHLKIFLCLNFSSLSMVSNRNKMWTTHVILNVLGVPLKE